MRWTVLVPAWLIVTSLAGTAPAQAQTSESTSSMERIRAALNQPPPRVWLPVAPGNRATFRVEVQERPFVLKPVEEEPFDPTFGLPSVGELLMGGIDKIKSTAVRYKHNRAVRRARKEVDDALAALCAVRECPPAHDGVH